MGDTWSARLVLGPQIDRSGRLVLGDDDGGAPALPDVLIAGAPVLPGLGVRAGLLRCAVALAATAALPGLAVRAGGLRYQSNTQRPTVAAAGTAWQVAAAGDGAQASPTHQVTAARPAAAQARWQRGRDGAAQVVHPLPGVLAALALPGVAPWQAAQARHEGAAWLHQQALRTALARLATWQEGQRRHMPVGFGHQDANRLPRAWAAAPWQAGHALRLGYMGHHQGALALHRPGRAPWQKGVPPPAGMSVRPVTPPKPPCYDPATLGRIVFTALADGTGRVVFVCERGGPGPQPPRFVIPVLEVYMSMHQISAVLLPSLEPVVLSDVIIDSDDGSFGWSLSASGPEHLLEQLAPVGGLPARIRVTIDGFDWVFAVERIGRTRSFGRHRCAIQGRSTTALLGEPYMPQQSWLGTSLQTAQQLVAGALEFTGTALDWGIVDWLVPAGAWSITGTPLQAALRVADSVGAVVRSHRTDQQLVFAPRYPVLPWEWDAAVPDVQMPADIITTDGLDPDPRPAYNAVYVSGQAQGVLGHVRRAGTAGDLLAPQVTDALITHADAARQRGIAVLGAAGNKLAHRMTLPFLTGGTNPGPVLPGYLIEVADIGHTWRGLVRGISIKASMPVVRQTINVERNA